jgi:hypothetical protein
MGPVPGSRPHADEGWYFCMVMPSPADVTAPPLVLEDGCILGYRIFDVGDEIHLEEAEKLLENAPGRKRARLTRDGAQCLEFSVSPLDIALGKKELTLASGRTLEVELTARLYDYAAVSVMFEWPIPSGTSLDDLLPLCDEVYESSVLEDAARREVALLVSKLHGAIQGHHDWNGVETYTVVFVRALRGNPPRSQIMNAPVMAKLLLGEPGPKNLSLEEQRDVLEHAHSYFEDDLAIIDWNSAFVLEPSGSRDIPDILEFGTSQLLELRYYDGLLDQELKKIYDEFDSARRQPRVVFRSPYERLARDVLRRFVELSEFTERVDNALKVVGDFYLARVYQSAVRRFRVPSWQASVDGKQALVAQAYNLLKGEVEIRRSTLLEIIVIVLILLELIAAVRGKG